MKQGASSVACAIPTKSPVVVLLKDVFLAPLNFIEWVFTTLNSLIWRILCVPRETGCKNYILQIISEPFSNNAHALATDHGELFQVHTIIFKIKSNSVLCKPNYMSYEMSSVINKSLLLWFWSFNGLREQVNFFFLKKRSVCVNRAKAHVEVIIFVMPKNASAVIEM